MFMQSFVPYPETKNSHLSQLVKSVIAIAGLTLYFSDSLESPLFLKV